MGVINFLNTGLRPCHDTNTWLKADSINVHCIKIACFYVNSTCNSVSCDPVVLLPVT